MENSKNRREELKKLYDSRDKFHIVMAADEAAREDLIKKGRTLMNEIGALGEKISRLSKNLMEMSSGCDDPVMMEDMSLRIMKRTKELLKCAEKYEELARKHAQNIEEYGELMEEHQQRKDRLDEVDAEIDKLTKATIVVHGSGEITADEDWAEINDAGWKSLFEDLLHNPKCARLRLLDVRAIAKLYQIIKNGNFSSYDLVFKNEEAEKVFYRLFTS